jgi:transglutaminase superfamily protein
MRVRGHRRADYATMAETMLLAIAIETGLRLRPISIVMGWLDGLRPSASRMASTPSYGLERFAAAAYRLLPLRATCLRESLVLYALLRRRAATPRLCLGVKREGDTLTAHSWIECGALTTRREHAAFVQLTASR